MQRDELADRVSRVATKLKAGRYLYQRLNGNGKIMRVANMCKRPVVAVSLSVCVLIGAGTLSGCATGNHHTETSSLTAASDQKTIHLDKEYDFKWTFKTGEVTFSLTPGRYVAEFNGQGGTFYRGPTSAVREVNRRTGKNALSWQHEGGIFVPTANVSAAKIYFYVDSRAPETLSDAAMNIAVPPTATPGQTLTGGVGAAIGAAIVAAAIMQDNGKIFFPPDQPEDSQLRSSIRF